MCFHSVTYGHLYGNWALVAAGGEFARTILGGVGNPSWWKAQLQRHLDRFTPNGEKESSVSLIDKVINHRHLHHPCRPVQGYNRRPQPHAL
jgi:hypothetical protein